MKTKKIISLLLRLAVAVILLQTLFFKFTAHPDSIYIFTKLGVEPWGRIGLGILEIITAILVLVPKTKTIGMLVNLGLMLGAIASHLFILGIDVGDGGSAFALAISVLVIIVIYFILNKKDLTNLIYCKK